MGRFSLNSSKLKEVIGLKDYIYYTVIFFFSLTNMTKQLAPFIAPLIIRKWTTSYNTFSISRAQDYKPLLGTNIHIYILDDYWALIYVPLYLLFTCLNFWLVIILLKWIKILISCSKKKLLMCDLLHSYCHLCKKHWLHPNFKKS